MLWSGLTEINLRQIFIVSPLIVISFLNLTLRMPYTSKNQLFIVKGYVLKDYVRRHWYLKSNLRVYILGLENRAEQLPEHQTKHGTGVPLVVTDHPQFDLYVEEQVKQVFTLDPFALFRSGFSLRNHLVRAKVYPLLREKGSSCWGKSRCETCFNRKETSTFQSFVTKKIYKINHHFHCDSKCVVYLLSCKV